MEPIKLMDRVRFIRLKKVEKESSSIEYKEEIHRGFVVCLGDKFVKIFNPIKQHKHDASSEDNAESYPIVSKRGWVEKI